MSVSGDSSVFFAIFWLGWCPDFSVISLQKGASGETFASHSLHIRFTFASHSLHICIRFTFTSHSLHIQFTYRFSVKETKRKLDIAAVTAGTASEAQANRVIFYPLIPFAVVIITPSDVRCIRLKPKNSALGTTATWLPYCALHMQSIRHSPAIFSRCVRARLILCITDRLFFRFPSNTRLAWRALSIGGV